LKPSDIVGPTLKGIRANRPLIFLNACSSAEADFGLSRIGGWAERFVSAGATAFVGSLWEVNDVLAAEFAIAFYRQLLAGKPLGEAFYLARQVIKQQDAANPTWLAYVLYAHPNGAVTLGE
jgi:CHAT domain-containing protein